MVWCLGAALFGLSTRRITKQVAVVVVAMVAAVGDAVAVVHVVASDAAASEVFVEMSETHSNTTVCMAALCFSPTSLVAWRFESGLLTKFAAAVASIHTPVTAQQCHLHQLLLLRLLARTHRLDDCASNGTPHKARTNSPRRKTSLPRQILALPCEHSLKS